MRFVTAKVPDIYVEGLDELVRRGLYRTRSEAVRAAIRELLRRELWRCPEGAAP
ncbi:MAG: ribbon-helix-helix domain-containing protein [Desulfurococcales archaeon]|nr:ribbon-helix-helix domain-containing protein [Desulfurococcales archaeon]